MTSRMIRHFFNTTVLLGVLFLVMFGYSHVQAEGLTHKALQTNTPQTVQLGIGSSLIIDSPMPFSRASVANPEVADTLILSPKQIYLTGKTIGGTRLTLWGKDKVVSNIFEVLVTPDLTRLKAQLHDVFPEENNIKVTSGHEGIALSGLVSNSANLAYIVEMAEPYAPGKVVNLLQVGGVHQVMLEVQVAEMSRGLARRFGINVTQLAGDQFFIGTLNDLSSFTRDADGLTTLLPAAVSNAFLGFSQAGSVWRIILDFAKTHNLSKILAEPTLIAMSGQEASFLAGGEFPIPVPQALGVTTIQFKEFGVKLGFNPTVLSDKKMSLKISPEVSELDFGSGVNFGGFTIPAITTRRASTILELDDGQSFAIAGLIQESIRESVAKYPLLGDIPLLGALFRSTQFQKNETELVIIVTPRLVKPLDVAKQPLPTDRFLEPNAFEQMLLGYMEGVPNKEAPLPSTDISVGPSDRSLAWQNGGLEGVFGHLAP